MSEKHYNHIKSIGSLKITVQITAIYTRNMNLSAGKVGNVRMPSYMQYPLSATVCVCIKIVFFYDHMLYKNI